MTCFSSVCGYIILVKSYTGNSIDFRIAEPIIKPYFNNRSDSIILPWKRMDGATSSDNISVLLNTMACLGGLGLHANMDSDEADGRFKYH